MSTRSVVSFSLIFALTLISPCTPLLSQESQTGSVPTKIRVSPVNLQNRMGDPVPVELQLLDASGRPVSARENVNAEVEVLSPSGQSTKYPVTFTPGESSKQIPVTITGSGVAKLSVQQREQHLIGGSAFVLVRPPQSDNAHRGAAQRSTGKQTSTSDKSKGPSSRLQVFPGPHLVRANFILAAFPPQVPAPAPGQPGSAAQLALTVSGEDASGGTRADGTTCAHVQAFYLGADDLLKDVQIWLTFSNGSIDKNPIVIAKGTAVGEACWTSLSPIQAATLQVAATKPPNFTFASTGNSDPTRLTHKFTDNIGSIDFLNAPQSITIVDNFKLTAEFKDPHGQPVKLTDKRDVHFSTDAAFLQLNPLQTTVDTGGFDSSTVLVPTYFGKSTVQVSTPDFPIAVRPITITWVGVLLASLLGGLGGGVLGWINSAGKLWARIVTGALVGLVASWAYVIVGLPKLETAFLHNQLSVFFVSLLFGLSGVKGLAGIASKFNFPSF